MKRIWGIVIVGLMSGSAAWGQAVENEKVDVNHFPFERKVINEREPLARPYIREADVVYARRIHRIIDSREKINLPLQWPMNPLNCMLYKAVTEGVDGITLTAYRNDSLVTPFTREEVLERGQTEEVIQIAPDPDDPEYLIDSVIVNEFDCERITRFEIMEYWVFDKQRGMMEPIIMAIAPLFKPEVEGVELNEQPMFWIKWDEAKNLLVKQEVFNRHNDAMRLSYYDFFELRLFSSYVIKEPNEFDFYIRDFEEFKNDPKAALYEGERIKNEIAHWEMDLWEY